MPRCVAMDRNKPSNNRGAVPIRGRSEHGMSTPREISPQTTYLLTRRCTERRFLLRPSALINQVLLYCLAEAADRFGVLVHAFCVMTNHYHLVATDVRGELPSFMHWLNEFVAKCLNEHHGRDEALWAPGSYSAVELVEEHDVLAKVVYTLQNPVAAGLVGASEAWPGAISRPEQMLGGSFTVARPPVFFSERGSLPESKTLTLAPPPNVDAERFVSDAAELLQIVERQHRERAASAGRGFLGRKRVMAQHPEAAPKTKLAKGGLNPTVACKDKWRRIETLQRRRRFQQAYREAWQSFRDRHPEAVFPSGTYWMVQVANRPCAST
jgi:putative transposase